MKKDTILVQCKLQNENTETVAWLEESKVKVGRQVLTSDVFDKSQNKKWWTVLSIGTEKVSYEKMADRKSSDVWDIEVNKIKGNK
jgi:hypothetical protein